MLYEILVLVLYAVYVYLHIRIKSLTMSRTLYSGLQPAVKLLLALFSSVYEYSCFLAGIFCCVLLTRSSCCFSCIV